jgi:regulator of sigma E protease
MDRGKDAGPFLFARYPFTIAEVSADSPNKNADLKSKDIVTAINGHPITYFDEAQAELNKYKNEEITATVKRGNETKNVALKVTNEGKIGVSSGLLSFDDMEKLGYYDLATIEYSFAEAIPAGFEKSWKTLTDYIKQLKKIFNPNTGAYKGLGGFISIGSIFPEEWSAQTFWNITAFLSIMLGFMNLLPIPALDGGHVVFTLWEMITGKKPGDKFLEYAQVTGFIILIALLLFANGNDIIRLFN